jgi:hypothetical protein
MVYRVADRVRVISHQSTRQRSHAHLFVELKLCYVDLIFESFEQISLIRNHIPVNDKRSIQACTEYLFRLAADMTLNTEKT